ncbi:DUF3993 domain-containing protein [Sutcliffiella horikoshii]|uniref:DUF3993 domain-containing protein n=1 Tax=Sutcliffiella horikoshii TaxID=79883 RepID=UPI00384B5F32
MLKKVTGIIAIITFIFLGLGNANAEQSSEYQEVYSFLKEAFQAQLSLGEKHHSLDEIDQILNPYFTKDYQQSFLKEHLFKEEAGYITYGTDFPAFYIPFFQYDHETKVIKDQSGDIIVYEHFTSEEDMPSLYDDHYEYVKIQDTSAGWKVIEYGFEYEIPEFVINDESFQVASLVETTSLTSAKSKIIYPSGMFAYPFISYSPLAISIMASHIINDLDRNTFLVTR